MWPALLASGLSFAGMQSLLVIVALLKVWQPATVVFAAAVIAALLARLPAATTVRLFFQTIVQMTPSLFAISFMVGSPASPGIPGWTRFWG